MGQSGVVTPVNSIRGATPEVGALRTNASLADTDAELIRATTPKTKHNGDAYAE